MRHGDMLALYTNWHGIQLVNDKSTDYQGCWVAYMLTQWPVYMAWDVDQTRSQLVHIILHVNYWTYSPAHMACQLGLTGPSGTTCQLIRLIHEGQWFAWMGNVLLKDVGHQTKQTTTWQIMSKQMNFKIAYNKSRVEVYYLNLCTKIRQYQLSIWHIVDHKTTQIWWLANMEYKHLKLLSLFDV